MDYHSEFRQSIDQPDAFWREKASAIDWMEPPKTIWQPTDNGHGEWFPDGVLNTSDIALDANIRAGRGEQKALIYDSPVTGTTRSYTYNELTRAVATFAGALQDRGITKGDRVILYMPMIPEAVIAMLGCARIGAIHSVVFGGFASNELAVRIDDAKPKAVITASCGIEVSKVIEYKPLVDKAIDQADHKPECCIVFQRPQAKATLQEGRDFDWGEMVSRARAVDPVPVRATDPLYILYTSGTTGKPKGVVRDNGGHAVALRYSMHLVYDASPGDVYWAASDVGWVVGHSYIVYGPLANGGTTLMFEGVPTYPDASRFWKVCEKHKVNQFYTAPTAIRALMGKGEQWAEGCDLSSLKVLGTVGEPINPEAWEWYDRVIGKGRVPIVDTWWQTETGGHMITSLPGAIATKPGSATLPFFGVKPVVLDPQSGAVLEATEVEGVLAIADSWPGQMRTIWGDHDRFEQTYFSQYKGFYFSGDGCRRDADGYYWITGRVDDVINVSGHRMGTAEVESALVAHKAVSEAAVVGYPHEIKGQGIYAYVTLMEGVEATDELRRELEGWVRREIGPIAKPDCIQWAPGLPKTRSGKIMRRILRKIAENDHDSLGDTSTLAEPQVVEDLIANRMNRN